MQVINRDHEGNEVDLTTVTVPTKCSVYDVCKDIYLKGKSDDRNGYKDAVEEVKT